MYINYPIPRCVRDNVGEREHKYIMLYVDFKHVEKQQTNMPSITKNGI